MIIIISGNQGSGKSTFARALVESIFPQNPVVIEGIPKNKPGFLGSMTIFTCQSDDDIPKWLLKRKDFTLIRLPRVETEYLKQIRHLDIEHKMEHGSFFIPIKIRQEIQELLSNRD